MATIAEVVADGRDRRRLPQATIAKGGDDCSSLRLSNFTHIVLFPHLSKGQFMEFFEVAETAPSRFNVGQKFVCSAAFVRLAVGVSLTFWVCQSAKTAWHPRWL